MSEKNPKLDPDGTMPKVPGLISLTEAGDRLGYTRQYAYRMAKAGKFSTLQRLGNAHIFTVAEAEVEQMRKGKEVEQEITQEGDEK